MEKLIGRFFDRPNFESIFSRGAKKRENQVFPTLKELSKIEKKHKIKKKTENVENRQNASIVLKYRLRQHTSKLVFAKPLRDL